MSISESSNVDRIFDQLKDWPISDRLRLARRILETLEAGPPQDTPGVSSLPGLLGLLRTDVPPPTDEECRAILEEELARKHLR